MGTPQIIYLVLTGIGIGVALSRHGKPKDGYENFWVDFISIAIGYSLLISGGFFE